MKINYPYLKDNDFLISVLSEHLQEQYVKIILLDWEENPIQEITGLCTSGSESLNGDSALRRTGSIGVYLKDESYAHITNVDNLFSLNKKIFIEIGLKNHTAQYLDYPIIWFPQGVMVICGASASHQASGTTLNLSYKDKMCLLNGECGGTIPASTQLDEYETIDENGNMVLLRPTIYQIIGELVNHFGGEQGGKILIDDVDTRVKQIMRWVGGDPVYMYGTGQSKILTTNHDEAAAAEGGIRATYEYGDDIGYIYTDFTYPGELVAAPGDSVVTILDKIKSTLGNYEYFYDVEGNFRFQEIKNYLNISQATDIIEALNNGTANYNVWELAKGKSEYDFTNSELITAYSNSPQYNKIKNDYVIWGTRQSDQGLSIPIRYHLAIDKKPAIGNTYDVYMYTDPDDGLRKAKMPIERASLAMFPEKGAEGNYYKALDTGNIYIWNGTNSGVRATDYTLVPAIELTSITTTDWRTELYLQGVVAEPLGLESNYYYAELAAEWPKLYDIENGEFYPEVLQHPEAIDYFLDFIDVDTSIAKISVNNIGRRTYAKVNDKINCVFEPKVEDLVIIEAGQPDTASRREECIQRGQVYTQVDSTIYGLLATGGLLNSAYNEIRNQIYQGTSYNESIQITTLPLYYLEPNIRITAFDIDSDIHGDYMIKSISIPFTLNGTSSISATRALNKI